MRNYIIIILMIFTSCYSVKEKTYTKRELTSIIDSVKTSSFKVQKDTFKTSEKVYLTRDIETVVSVPVDCDEEGNVKNINYSTKSGNNHIKAKIINNELILDFKLDSVTNRIKEEYRSKYVKDSVNLHEKLSKEIEVKESLNTVVHENTWFKHLKCYLFIIIFVIIFFLLRRFKIL